MTKKAYALIRVSLENKKLFDAIAIKHSKKTNGLFEEMCLYYKNHFLNADKNEPENDPLNLEEAIFTLRKSALDFLNMIEKMNFLVEKTQQNSTSKNENELLRTSQIKKVFAEILSLIKSDSPSKISSKNIQKLQSFIDKI